MPEIEYLLRRKLKMGGVMASSLTGYGLVCLWVGAMSLGGVVLLKKDSPPSPPPPADGKKQNTPLDGLDWSSPSVRKSIEAICLFTGASGLIVGLGLLGLGAMH